MKYTVIPITMFIITILPKILTWAINKKANKLFLKDITERRFTSASWLYMVYFIGIPISILFFYVSYITLDDLIFCLFMFGIGSIFFALSIYGLYLARHTYILIDDDLFIYHDGRKVKVSIGLSDIRNIYIENFFIAVDVGEKYRKAIPMYFKNISSVIAILRHYVDSVNNEGTNMTGNG